MISERPENIEEDDVAVEFPAVLLANFKKLLKFSFFEILFGSLAFYYK
jgi:hypothetical protein